MKTKIGSVIAAIAAAIITAVSVILIYSENDGSGYITLDRGETGSVAIERQAQAPDVTEDMVYVTENGEKYHAYGCSYLKNGVREISLSDAFDRGYEPCSRCIGKGEGNQ